MTGIGRWSRQLQATVPPAVLPVVTLKGSAYAIQNHHCDYQKLVTLRVQATSSRTRHACGANSVGGAHQFAWLGSLQASFCQRERGCV